MKLDPPDGKLLVLHAHDFSLLRFSCDFEALGKRGPADHEGMIACSGKRVWHPFEKVLPVMFNRRGLTMHHPVIHHHVSSKNVPDALVPEANAKSGNP